MAEFESNGLTRRGTNDIEIGVSDALQKHITRQVAPQKPISQKRLDFEYRRPRIIREMAAEALGVFIYVFAGIGSRASYLLAEKNAAPGEVAVAGYESLIKDGFAFGFGIAFAIIVCASTSGGHFNPALTISFMIWQGFPWRKAILYILSQIFGAFLAGLFLMGCYWPAIQTALANDTAQGVALVSNTGLASLLCSFPAPTQTNQGFLFFQEFFVDSFIALVIWACLDPANNFVSPQSVPFAIGLAYSVAVWGYAGNTLSTNLARDLGTRLVSAIFFGGESFTYSNGYAWIAILVNIPSTLFATGVYEVILRDSLKKIGVGHAEHKDGDDALRRHVSKITGADIVDTSETGDKSVESWVEKGRRRAGSDQGTLVDQSINTTDFGNGRNVRAMV